MARSALKGATNAPREQGFCTQYKSIWEITWALVKNNPYLEEQEDTLKKENPRSLPQHPATDFSNQVDMTAHVARLEETLD